MCEYGRLIFNYEIEEKEKCSDCKYHHWYYDEGKKYGCPSTGGRICGSFREWKGEAATDGGTMRAEKL